MTLKEKIMKLQTYKMFEGEETLYVERDDVLKLLEQEPSGNSVSREAVCEIINDIRDCISVEGYCAILERMKKLPSVNPQEPTWVTGADGAKIAFKDVPAWKVIKICEILADVVEAEEQEPTGHWEWLTEDKYRCSNCNSETRVDECMNEPMYEFCPFLRCKNGRK